MDRFTFRPIADSHVQEVFLGASQFIGLVRQTGAEWRADRRAFASREEAARWLAGVAW